MGLSLGLKAYCHVNNNDEDDRFVGIKIDNVTAKVCFPLGYELSQNDEDIRYDIIKLITVLSDFADSQGQLITSIKPNYSQIVDFPVNAYIHIIRCFLDQKTYYCEKEKERYMGDRGKIHWATTLKRNVSFYQKDGTPFFNKYTIVGSTPNENNIITMIHKYCVYEAFKKMGWIFTSYLPRNPHIVLNKNLFLNVLQKKFTYIFNDKDKLLFEAMISMINCLDGDNSNKICCYGTERFEYVWEQLIDKVFGVEGKERFFPKTQWQLKYAKHRDNYTLEPDTIMEYNDKTYVLDAKYYRYGVTGVPSHLPETTSINKQITYGEFAYKIKNNKKTNGKKCVVFNAFLMPYNMHNNPFMISRKFANIGEATSEWKKDEYIYERVQGIVVDVRSIINNYRGAHMAKVKELAEVIEESNFDNEKTH